MKVNDDIKKYARVHDVKMYELANQINTSFSNLYTTYLHKKLDKSKRAKLIDAINEIVKKKAGV